jgi:hypothetical protein
LENQFIESNDKYIQKITKKMLSIKYYVSIMYIMNTSKIIFTYLLNKSSPFFSFNKDFISYDCFNVEMVDKNIYKLTILPPFPHSRRNNGFIVYFLFNNNKFKIIYSEEIQSPIQLNFISCKNNNLFKYCTCTTFKTLNTGYILSSNNPLYVKKYCKPVNNYKNIYFTSLYLWDYYTSKTFPIFSFETFYDLFKDYDVLPLPSHTFDYIIIKNTIYFTFILQQEELNSYVLCIGKNIVNGLEQSLKNLNDWDYFFYYKTKKPDDFIKKSHCNGIKVIEINNKFYIITTDRNGYISFSYHETLNIKTTNIVNNIKTSCFKIKHDNFNYPYESLLREVHNIYAYEDQLYLFGNSRATIVNIGFSNPSIYFQHKNLTYNFITTKLSNRINNQENTLAVFGSITRIKYNNGSFLIINQGTTGKAKSCDNFGSTRIYLGDYEKILEYYGGYSTELLINS